MKARKGEPLFVTSDSDNDMRHGDYATAVGLLMKGFVKKEPEVVEQEIFEPGTVEVVAPLPPTPGGRHKKKIKDIIGTIPDMFGDFFTIANKDNRV